MSMAIMNCHWHVTVMKCCILHMRKVQALKCVSFWVERYPDALKFKAGTCELPLHVSCLERKVLI